MSREQLDPPTGAPDGPDGSGPRVVLLTRTACPPCARAAETLDALGVPWRGVDVDEAAADSAAGREQRAEFGDRVPVVLLDGHEHSWGEVDVPRLQADLVD